MKVTPLDIRRKEFKRSMRGYADEEVDIFLDEVADEFERLFQENAEMHERLQRLEEQLESHAQLRTALEKTLVSAQLQADHITANARKESELIMRDAELRARNIVSESYAETQKVQQALVQLKHLEEDFRFKFRSLLEGHLKLLSEAPMGVAAAKPAVASGPASAPEEQGAVVEGEQRSAPGDSGAPEQTDRAQAASPLGPPPVWTEPARETAAHVAPAESAQTDVATIEAVDGTGQEETRVRWPEEDHQAELETDGSVGTGETEAERLALLSTDDIPTEETEAPDAQSLDAPMEDEPSTGAGEAAMGSAPAASAIDDSGDDAEVRGFFFGKQMGDVDDSFISLETPKKDGTRDFEW